MKVIQASESSIYISLASVPVNVCRHLREYNSEMYVSVSNDLALMKTNMSVYNL